MITFKYTDEFAEDHDTGVALEVTTPYEHLEGVIEAFKTFLHHVGHHPANIERIVFQEKQQGLPVQLELPL